jgi:bile acid:Na+ symporter, BASS family
VEDSLAATVLLPIATGLIIFSLGLSLTPADFKRIVVAPRGVLIGLGNLLALSPLLAFAVATVFALDPALAVGLVLLGASPGGAMANMLTHLARGRLALSVTMTAVSSVAAVVTVPLFLGLAIAWFDARGLSDDVEMAGVVARVFAITVVPLTVAMTLRARFPAWVAENEPRAKRLALGAFLLIVAGAVASEWEVVADNLAEVAAAAVALNVIAMGASYTIARAARLDDPSATAIAMELGIHNSTLTIAVGASIATVLTIPAAVYSAFMFVTAGLFARIMYRRNGAATAAAADARRLPQRRLDGALEGVQAE